MAGGLLIDLSNSMVPVRGGSLTFGMRDIPHHTKLVSFRWEPFPGIDYDRLGRHYLKIKLKAERLNGRENSTAGGIRSCRRRCRRPAPGPQRGVPLFFLQLGPFFATTHR